MTVALVYLGASVLALMVLSFLYTYEDRQGGRVCLVDFRNWIDRTMRFSKRVCVSLANRLGGRFVRLMYYYGVHQLTKRVLKLMRHFETRLESLQRRNRAAAREMNVDRTPNHLDAIAEHKEESTLSKRQRDKLLKQ